MPSVVVPMVTAEGIPIISSYLPQEAVDKKNYEGEFNILAQGNDDNSTGGDSELSEKKHHGKTNHKNFGFWLEQDITKATLLLTNQLNQLQNHNTTYDIYPDSDTVCDCLRSNKNRHLYFDIETDTNLNITCFAFAFSLDKVFVVPVFNHLYEHAYPCLPNIFGALAVGIRNNILVCHNGSGFDYLVLGHKYRIPINRVYDTLLAQSRIFPGIDKSLGHCISLPWMFEPYHKDEGNFALGNREQAMQLWKYCGKDVSTLMLLKQAQDKYAASRIGLRESIDSVNSYVKPYVTTTLLGIRYSEDKVNAIWKRKKRCTKMAQYLRMLDILIGRESLKKIRGTGKSSMPNSPRQCCKYFYEMLNYPVPQGSRSEEGNPKGDKKAIFKLKLRFNNPVLDLVIAYRRLSKESGSLKFIPFTLAWKGNNEQNTTVVIN